MHLALEYDVCCVWRLIEYGCDLGGLEIPKLTVTARVCTPVRWFGCRIINIGCECWKRTLELMLLME
jgi:hypothetical protein